MNWSSPEAFFAMGGYALYVWGSVGACAAALAIEIVALRQRRNAALHLLRRRRRVDRVDGHPHVATVERIEWEGRPS